MKKNIFLLLFTLFSFSAIHADNDIKWTLSYNGTLTISGTDMPDYDRFHTPWNNNLGKIKEVVIKDGVTNIGTYAFSDCEKLTSITIPNSVTSIESSVFNKCTALTSITIPNSVTSIGDWAFFYCI